VAKATTLEIDIDGKKTKALFMTSNIQFPKEPLVLKQEEPTKPSIYSLCVDIWLKKIHPGWLFGGAPGKALKSIIKKITTVCQAAGYEATDEAVVALFEKFCVNLPDWFKDKDLQTLDQKFNEIVTQIQQGGKKPEDYHGRNSSARMFSKYKDLF